MVQIFLVMTKSIWREANKPWQFLKWCFEWAGYLEQGFNFASRMPVALDGSYSGIQHFSGMLRDAVGGRAVNLIPTEKPSDTYQKVADLVNKKLEERICEAGEDKKLAQECFSLNIDRKTTKKQVMTLPYGATSFSCRKYTEI